MLAERILELSEAQRAIASHDGRGGLTVIGPPGSGKTTALAALASRWSLDREVTVFCANDASCAAFEAAARVAGCGETIAVDTLAGHLCAWMRREFAACSASPMLHVGGDGDSIALAREAGSAILDMSWPGFRNAEFTLDLPFLARPDVFFEEAAGLFRQLRRRLVEPAAFDAACASGIAAFYGADVERARALCADPQLRSRASRRGRDAMSATVDQLRVQRRAERDLASMLVYLYGAYIEGARGKPVLCAEDISAECIAWLRRDRHAVERLVASSGGIIVDDAEDAEPALASLLDQLGADAGDIRVAIGSCAASAIEGIRGRRSLALGDAATSLVLPPRAAHASATARRYADESAEADSVAGSIRDLLERGTAPADIFVLTRDLSAAMIYVNALSDRGVPICAPRDTWQSPEDVADLLALAAIVDDPYDHARILRVLASPVVGLSDLSLLRLCRDPADADQLALDVGLDDARLSGARGPASTTLAENVLYGAADQRLSEPARAALASFRERWREWRRSCATMQPAAALSYLMDAAGFRSAWHARPHYMRRRLADDARRLLAAACFVDGSLGDVAATLEAGAVALDSAEQGPDAVMCSTIAGVKGLRAPHVFIVGVAHNRFPRIYVSHALAFTKQWGLIARENVAGGASQAAKFAWYYAKHGAKSMYIEEERRALAYAISRADVAAHVSGYGSPPRWAADQDLLSVHGV